MYSKFSLTGAWTYGENFTADAVGVVTEDTVRVVQVGDSVPEREVQPPVGTGSTFTGFDSFSVTVSGSYTSYKGAGEFFNGAYTYRIADGERFTVAENFALARTFGNITGMWFHGDRELIFGTEERNLSR